jgi:D-arabinose 1-dehydrogenase-like Zn-dependent alcohol dehydrogenase
MRAIVRDRYGSPPDGLELLDVEKPVVGEDEVLVRVRASSVNPVDWHGVTGTPYVARLQGGLRGPKSPSVGVDFAGVVEAIGARVMQFAPGDEVFGGRNGAFAEYVSVRNAIAPKPANLTFEEAAAVPVAAITALQGLRDKGTLEPGQKVLVNGASGGVGAKGTRGPRSSSRSENLRKDLARVHDPVRVERRLEATHEVDALVAVLEWKQPRLAVAHSVLAGARPAERDRALG